MSMAETSENPVRPAPQTGTARYTGEVVYIYAFDIAYDTARRPMTRLLGQAVEHFSMDANRRSPRQLSFHRPEMVRLPVLERVGPHGPVPIQRTIKFLSIGAISITVRVPFAVPHLQDLIAFHDLQFSDGSLQDHVYQLAHEVVVELKGRLQSPHPHWMEEEAYTVFCIAAPIWTASDRPTTALHWFQAHRRQVAALLAQELEIERLSQQETDESTSRHLSYYEDDLVVIDWDAALLIDDPSAFDETLHILELANLQLTELEAYDRLLDDALERSYRDLSRDPLRPRRDILRELREIRIDMARFNDELSNTTKFFGDWHLARIHEQITTRLHLAEWHRTIEGKLRILNDLYQILKHDQANRWMVILEATIVLLFIIDLVILFMGLQ